MKILATHSFDYVFSMNQAKALKQGVYLTAKLHEFAIEQVLVDEQYKKAKLNRIGAGVEQSNLNVAKWYELSAKHVNPQHSFVWAEHIPKDTDFIKMIIWRIVAFSSGLVRCSRCTESTLQPVSEWIRG